MSKKKTPKEKGRALLLTAKQMSKVSGIGENTLRELMASRQLEYLQIGAHRLLCEKAIWDYYERNKTRSVEHSVAST